MRLTLLAFEWHFNEIKVCEGAREGREPSGAGQGAQRFALLQARKLSARYSWGV